MVLFICDDCKWDYPSSCHNPKRPNITIQDGCKDFTPKSDKYKLYSKDSTVFKKIRGE